ncbi:hypothetical protein HRbin09_00426 [bacterium HR09]|nr:hypothetical protein HRbin09_00426 [bacterium HR09]
MEASCAGRAGELARQVLEVYLIVFKAPKLVLLVQPEIVGQKPAVFQMAGGCQMVTELPSEFFMTAIRLGK